MESKNIKRLQQKFPSENVIGISINLLKVCIEKSRENHSFLMRRNESGEVLKT